MAKPLTELAARLEMLRNARRWSRNELARQIGIDQGTISNIMNNKNRPSPETIDAIAAFTGWDARDIFAWSTLLHGVVQWDSETPVDKANRRASGDAAALQAARRRRGKG